MSNDKTTANQPVPVADSDDSSTEAKRPNILVRATRKIKSTPPRTAIAVGLGVTLVGAGAFLGRKTAPYSVEVVEADFEPEPLVSVETDDTQTA